MEFFNGEAPLERRTWETEPKGVHKHKGPDVQDLLQRSPGWWRREGGCSCVSVGTGARVQECLLYQFLYFYFSFIIKIFFLSLIPQKREGREKERERNINVREKSRWRLPLACTPTRDRTHNPGMCPDQESNPGLLALQDGTQPTTPHCPGFCTVIYA